MVTERPGPTLMFSEIVYVLQESPALSTRPAPRDQGLLSSSDSAGPTSFASCLHLEWRPMPAGPGDRGEVHWTCGFAKSLLWACAAPPRLWPQRSGNLSLAPAQQTRRPFPSRCWPNCIWAKVGTSQFWLLPLTSVHPWPESSSPPQSFVWP